MKTNLRARSSSSSPEPRSKSTRSTSTSTGRRSSAAFKVGVISLAFLIMGYQICLFMERAARMRVEANRDRPDTVYVYVQPEGAHGPEAAPARQAGTSASVPQAQHSPVVQKMREDKHASKPNRKVESFRFDPNTAMQEEFERLGFSEKQAQSIINYRMKGGRFRRPSDFAKSYVVADSVFQRLEPYIDIPKVDINAADSATFDALPGIGPWFAARMVKYREELGGYGSCEQLLDIRNFDEEKYAALKDLITCSSPHVLEFWSLDEEALRALPAVRSRETAHAIVLYRRSMPKEKWTLEGLLEAGVLTKEQFDRLSRCRIAPIGGDDGSGSTPAM